MCLGIGDRGMLLDKFNMTHSATRSGRKPSAAGLRGAKSSNG
jgi:hypothetical protein